MSRPRLVIFQNSGTDTGVARDTVSLAWSQFEQWCRTGRVLRHLLRYRDVQLVSPRIECQTSPLLKAVLLRLLSHGTCSFADNKGRTVPLGLREFGRLARGFARDGFQKRALLRTVAADVDTLTTAAEHGCRHAPLDLSLSPVYLRTDLLFGLHSGGSVGHVAGVLNNLDAFCGKPVFLTADPVPTVRPDLETHIVETDSRFWDFIEPLRLHYNSTVASTAERILRNRRVSFLYHRYSCQSYAGVALAHRLGIPLVLEFNGSEVWVCRNWGRPLKYEQLAERVELLNLRSADVIVVVSRPIRDELTARGIATGRVLVNPNGVDPDRYSPAVDGANVRERLGLTGKTVIGFIGTFGKWHGAEVLAEAFVRLVQAHLQYRETLRLLMIGDGVTLPQVRDIIRRQGLDDICVFTGTVPQEQGPEYLAACDILVSPQVPNADGTPFFGSPTKLFEYMAMGKGIVASDLDQIGEVIEHGRTGWLVKPGDAEALAAGLQALLENPELRSRLGAAARQCVLGRHTWREHTRRIIEKLKELRPPVQGP